MRSSSPYYPQQGQGLVEYALVLALVAVITIGVLAVLGDQLQAGFCEVLMSLGEYAPEVTMCEVPWVTCGDLVNGSTVTNPISMEALVQENKGMENITHVEFYLDGVLTNTERIPHFCFMGGDRQCDRERLSPGLHTIRAIAHDKDGYEGTCEVTINVVN